MIDYATEFQHLTPDTEWIARNLRCYETRPTGFRVPAPLETADQHTPPTLRPVFDLVQDALHKADHGDGKLVILDDIATLKWVGFSLLDVSRFARALWGACLKVRRLSTRYHSG